MEKTFTEKFKQIIDQYGKMLLEEPRRLEAFLKDYCSENRKETNLIIAILREGVVEEFRKTNGKEISEYDFIRITKKVAENTFLSEEAIKSGLWLLGEVTGKQIPETYIYQNHTEVRSQTYDSSKIIVPKPTELIESVKIGNQIWMTKNLDINRFRNGDIIPEIQEDHGWEQAGKNSQPACCYYNNDPVNCKKYGKLYNWYAVTDPRGLAPGGYHIPYKREFEALKYSVGNYSHLLKAVGQGTRAGAGTNESSFSALLAGCRATSGHFYSEGFNTYFWSFPEIEVSNADYMYLNYDNNSIGFSSFDKAKGFSIRCLKD